MKKMSIISVFGVCISLTANAQFSMFGGTNRANQDNLRKIAAADYADMLAKVGVAKELDEVGNSRIENYA